MEVANLYDNGPISPICQIKEHLAVWTEQRWVGFEVDFIEPQPRSSAFVIDLVAVTGGGVVLPGGTIAAQLLNAIQVNANELAHLRFFVLDDIEAQLWQLSNMARFAP